MRACVSLLIDKFHVKCQFSNYCIYIPCLLIICITKLSICIWAMSSSAYTIQNIWLTTVCCSLLDLQRAVGKGWAMVLDVRALELCLETRLKNGWERSLSCFKYKKRCNKVMGGKVENKIVSFDVDKIGVNAIPWWWDFAWKVNGYFVLVKFSFLKWFNFPFFLYVITFVGIFCAEIQFFLKLVLLQHNCSFC